MRENSIKEDIKIVENYLANSAMNEIDSNFFKNSGWETVDLEIPKSMQHILSDYKRVLKENELLRKDIEGWKKYCEEIEEEQTEMSNKNCELEFEVEKLQKENEELKQDKNNNYKMIALAQNEALGYMQGYEDGKKSKKSAVAFAVQNQEYYLIRKEIERYKEHIVKLQEENEDLHREINQRIKLKIENEKIVDTQFIPIQKIKDKIEEILNNGEYRIIFEGDAEFPDEATCIDAQKYIKLEKLQELLEGRK